MKKSTQHAVAQRLLALVGLTPLILDLCGYDVHKTPLAFIVIGLILVHIGVLSGLGVGPWGRYYSYLCVKDDEAYRATLKTKQPWEK